jgi:hypothetical protein
VFFQSPVALVPGALNEVPVGNNLLAQNVYEWQAQGTGGCEAAQGCIWLISDGKDRSEPGKFVGSGTELLGSDATGQNVFLATASRLIGADTDTQRDYYDARIGGGFAPSATPSACSEDGCRSTGTSPSPFGALGSFTFAGPGNPPARTIASEAGKPPPETPLAKALKQCKRKKVKKKRLACERAARKRFGPKHKKAKHRKGKAKKSTKAGRH